jgi:stage III sporulation protein AH
MVLHARPAFMLAILMLLLGTGYWFANRIADSPPAASDAPTIKILPQAASQKKTTNSAVSFFPGYRLQRERVRSQQLELLRDIINNSNTDDKTKEAAMGRLLSITSQMERELKAEGLLKAQGFREGVVIIQDDSATVVVSSPAMNEQKTEKTKSEMAGVLKTGTDQINVITRN